MIGGVIAELDESSVNVTQAEDIIISQFQEISVDEKRHIRDKVNELLRPYGLETERLQLKPAQSIALYFICLTLTALMNLRDQLHCGFRRTIESLFTLLSGSTRIVRVKRFTWLPSNYGRCYEFFSSLEGKQMVLS